MALFQKKKNRSSISRRNPSPGSNAPVFSYYANRTRDEQKTGRFQTPPSFKWHLIPTYIAILALLVSFIYVSTIDITPRIVHAPTSDTGILQADKVYQEAANEFLRRSVFNRSKLLLDTHDLEQHLADSFPELRLVSVTIPLINRRPIVAFEPASPALFLVSQGATYVIDDHGRAIIKAEVSPALQSLPRIQDDSDLRVKVGETIMPSATTNFIVDVKKQLAANNLELEAMILPAAINELHIRIKGAGYLLKFNTSGDARIQVGTYLAVRDKLNQSNVKPAEYIDVRVEEKVFYK